MFEKKQHATWLCQANLSTAASAEFSVCTAFLHTPRAADCRTVLPLALFLSLSPAPPSAFAHQRTTATHNRREQRHSRFKIPYACIRMRGATKRAPHSARSHHVSSPNENGMTPRASRQAAPDTLPQTVSSRVVGPDCAPEAPSQAPLHTQTLPATPDWPPQQKPRSPAMNQLPPRPPPRPGAAAAGGAPAPPPRPPKPAMAPSVPQSAPAPPPPAKTVRMAPPPPSHNSETKEDVAWAPSAAPAPAPVPAPAPRVKPENRFRGKNPLQFGLLAHNQAYASALLCFWLGIFAILWESASLYGCKIDGDAIDSKFILNDVTDTCIATYQKSSTEFKPVCCDPDEKSTLVGNASIGTFYIVLSIVIVIYENADYCYGLWYPTDTFWYEKRISPGGIAYFISGVVGLASYATCLAGVCLMATGVCTCYAMYRQEAGDGGREDRKKQKENIFDEYLPSIEGFHIPNVVDFFRRIYEEDKLSVYIWAFIYFAINLIVFAYTLHVWIGAVELQKEELLDGSIDYDCDSLTCYVNRQIVRFGPISDYGPWAKACGNCLNLNCSLILLPVIRLLLRKLNNVGESFNKGQHTNPILRYFARPLTRYIPLSKNIEFHKLVAFMVFVYAFFHTMFHFFNLWKSNETTLARFEKWGWGGTAFFTGAIISLAMFFIYTAGFDRVRHANFEIFFFSHHWFTVFFFFLFLHGPVFIYWAIVPVLLYAAERYMQYFRGNRPYVINRIEWIPPVMAIQFRPLVKEDFKFKEGQYLYLNCPYINAYEWHPFTISSAVDDLYNGARICLETGEEVVEVPRPKDWPQGMKWNKYCRLSQDWRKMRPEEMLDKSDTGYNDFVSVHVKVHGLEDPVPRSWTRKLKEYIELMNPGATFPFYFSHRDQRGDIVIGRQNGPDGQQILRVDGPHSAPTEHYPNYGTVMLIGAGIGLTPCASVLTALLKYRWKKNFNPEILHFYWVVRHNEIPAFQWFVHLLAELEYEMKRGRETNNIEPRYYCELNIFITGYDPKRPASMKPLKAAQKTYSEAFIPPSFTAEDLYAAMLNPKVTSKDCISKMQDPNAPNRFQDVWIWSGRPDWDAIFAYVKDQRQHSDIGVCFCGAPIIGRDLRACCEKFSSAKEQCLFSLHKENF